MYAEFFCGAVVTTNQKHKPLEKVWQIIYLNVFFNPLGETKEKPKMYAEFFCGAVVTKCHKPKRRLWCFN